MGQEEYYTQYIALAFDPQTESDLVFYVHARNAEHVRRQIRQYYKEQNWDASGIIIKVKSLSMPEGTIQMIGHRYVRGLDNLDSREKATVMHKDSR